MNSIQNVFTPQEFIEMGISVFPLQPKSKVPYENKAWNKYRNRFMSKKEIEEEFKADSNIAGILGEISGHIIDMDFDFRDEKEYINPEKVKMYSDFLERNPVLKKDVVIIKTDNGFHHIFKVKDSYMFKNKDFFMNGIVMGQIKSNGGYCLLPPSIHPYGSTYTFKNFVEFNKLPEIDVLSLSLNVQVDEDYISSLNPNKTKIISTLCSDMVYKTNSKYVENAVNNTKMRILQAGQGYRNTTINGEIFSLARLIPNTELTREIIISELYDIAVSLYDEDRTSDRQDIQSLLSVFNSAIDAGIKKPKELPRKR